MKNSLTLLKKNNKIFCIICLVSILILIFSLYNKKIVEYFYESDYNENNFINTGMYVLYVPKREQYIKDVMKKMKLNPEFVQGPDKTKLDLEQLKKDGIIAKNTEKSRGVLACYLGHLNIIQKFMNSNYKYALIFEDDIKLPSYIDDTYEKMKYSINNIPKNTNLLYLGFYKEDCNKLKKYNDIYNIPIRPSGTHCYLIDKKFAKTFIDTSYPIDTESDTKLINIKQLYDGEKVSRYSINPDYLSIRQNFDLQNMKEANRNKVPVCLRSKIDID